MTASGAFGVEGMDGAALERRNRILDEARFVQRVGVDRDLNVELVGDRQTCIDGSRRRAPILMKLETASPGLDLLDKRVGGRSVAFAKKTEIHRKCFSRLQH